MTLSYYEHRCNDCEQTTTHHIFEHENPGEEVRFWCEHCEHDVTGVITDEFVAKA